MIVAAQGRNQQYRVISPFLVKRIGALGHGEAGLAYVGFFDPALGIVNDLAEVIVEPADHDHGETSAWLDVVGASAADSGAVALGDGENLRDCKADGSGDGDSLCGAVFQYVQAR